MQEECNAPECPAQLVLTVHKATGLEDAHRLLRWQEGTGDGVPGVTATHGVLRDNPWRFLLGCWAEGLSLVPSFAMVLLGADPSRSPPWH